jgi:hypothetical protein
MTGMVGMNGMGYLKRPATLQQPGVFIRTSSFSYDKLHIDRPVVGGGKAGFLERFGVGRVGVRHT